MSKQYVEVNTDYGNLLAGDICEVVYTDRKGELCDANEEYKLFTKVVKVGMTQVHYLYSFEFKTIEIEKEDVWKLTLSPLVYFLAGTQSISSGRSFNDILREIDGGEMPSADDMQERGDLCPSSLLRELLKLLEENDNDEDMIDELIDGSMYKFVTDLFISAFYAYNYQTISHMVDNWAYYSQMVAAVNDTIEEGK